MSAYPIRRMLWAVELKSSERGWFPCGVGFFGWPAAQQSHLSMTTALFRTRREADKARKQLRDRSRIVRVRVTVARADGEA